MPIRFVSKKVGFLIWYPVCRLRPVKSNCASPWRSPTTPASRGPPHLLALVAHWHGDVQCTPYVTPKVNQTHGDTPASCLKLLLGNCTTTLPDARKTGSIVNVHHVDIGVLLSARGESLLKRLHDARVDIVKGLYDSQTLFADRQSIHACQVQRLERPISRSQSCWASCWFRQVRCASNLPTCCRSLPTVSGGRHPVLNLLVAMAVRQRQTNSSLDEDVICYFQTICRSDRLLETRRTPAQPL